MYDICIQPWDTYEVSAALSTAVGLCVIGN